MYAGRVRHEKICFRVSDGRSADLCRRCGTRSVPINNNYPGDTEAQAQMLYDLGLFKGTDKGFALEKSMTRAEASVMLTRSAWRRKDRAGRKLEASVYRCAAVGGQIRRLAVSEWFDQGRFRDTVRARSAMSPAASIAFF